MILNKSLNIGLAAKGINAVFPDLIPIHAIQLAQLMDYNRVQYPCYVSPKLDGLRGKFSEGKMLSRNGHEYKGLETLITNLQLIFGPYCELDGELMVEGKHFNEISGDIRSFKETDKVEYHIFDMPNLKHISLNHRLQALHEPFDRACNMLSPSALGIYLVPHHYAMQESDISDYYSHFISAGYEGVIVKGQDSLYHDGRTYDWMKIKECNNVDLTVVSIKEGAGKFKGTVGAINCLFGTVHVSVGSGLSDEQRARWWQEPELIVGKTVEVAYHEVTPDGSLRHPRLKQVRGDK